MKLLTWLFLFVSGFVFGQNKSLLYQIKGKDKKVSYIFGTIHMMPDSIYYFPGKLDKLISKSDEVVLEVANLSANQGDAVKRMTLESGSSFDIFTPEQKDSVLNWGAGILGMKPEQFEKGFEKRKPFMLMQLELQHMISGKIHLIDMEIESKAQSNSIPVSGLETMDYQLSIFDRMPEKETAELIMEMIRHPEASEVAFVAMLTAYRSQDIEKLSQLIRESDAMGSASDELLDKRNHNWVPKMDALMSSKSCFFAVGAGHLGGSNGVLELLRQKGYEVTPVKY